MFMVAATQFERPRVPQAVKTIILIAELGRGGKDYIDLELSSVIVYKVDPFKLRHICFTKYLLCISVAPQVCLTSCFL